MTPSAPAAQPGDLIADRYRVNRLIGEGGMSVVFEATDTDADRPVALKLMRRDARQHPQLVQRFLREARLAATLHGDGVVQMQDAGVLDNGQAYLVMERLVGEDLESCLRREGRLKLRDAVDTVLQAARALAAAHAAGVVHRDIKPGNLFLVVAPDGRRTVKLVDFGLSKLSRATGCRGMDSLTGPQVKLGTIHYMAPEQWRSPRDVDGRADVWALGVVLHELITGERPFDADNPVQLFEQVSGAPAPRMSQRVSGVPPELDLIGDRCLAKCPADRCELSELAAALEWMLEVLGAERPSAARSALFGPAAASADATPVSRCPTTLRSASAFATAHTELAPASFVPQVVVEGARALSQSTQQLFCHARELAMDRSLSSACPTTA